MPSAAATLQPIGKAYEAAQMRWVALNDAPRLAALWRAAYPEEAELHTSDALARALGQGGALAMQDPHGGLLAALRWRRERGAWRIERVATLPEARGQGYGRWLITKVEAFAIRQNVAVLLLTIPSDERDQVDYYRRMGYHPEAGEADATGEITLRKELGGVWQRKGPGEGA